MNKNEPTSTVALNKYYPACINEPVTLHNSAVQVEIVNKIMQRFGRKGRLLGRACLQRITAYIWRSPVKFICPLYQQVGDMSISYGYYLLKSRTVECCFKMQVNKYWQKLDNWEMGVHKVMRFAKHFDDFIQLKDYSSATAAMSNHTQSYETLGCESQYKIISQNNGYFYDIFRVLSKYKKDGVINEEVIRSFSQIMGRNILLISLENKNRYIIIDHKDNHQGNRRQYCSGQEGSSMTKIHIEDLYGTSQFARRGGVGKEEGRIEFSIGFEGKNVKIISDEYVVYKLVQRMGSRGRQVFVNPEDLQDIVMEDIYIL